MTRAALYLRVSTGEQRADNQRPEVEALARARGFDVVLVVEEAASTRGRRPGFERVQLAARRREIDTLVIWAIDRFGRDLAGVVNDVIELDRLGVELVSVRDPWLANVGPTRGLLVAMFSWVAQYERDLRGARVKAGLARLKAKGVQLGRPNKAARVNVTAARSMKASGKTWPEVARALEVNERTLYRALRSDKNHPAAKSARGVDLTRAPGPRL